MASVLRSPCLGSLVFFFLCGHSPPKRITKLIDKFTKLSKRSFSVECFITDFSRISGITANICFLEVPTGYPEFSPYRESRHCVKSVQIRRFFWAVFSRGMLCISPYLVQMRENTDQKKIRIWTHFTQWKAISHLTNRTFTFWWQQSTFVSLVVNRNWTKTWKVYIDT